jgi:hypothetical protein
LCQRKKTRLPGALIYHIAIERGFCQSQSRTEHIQMIDELSCLDAFS